MTRNRRFTLISIVGLVLLALAVGCSDDGGSCLLGDADEPLSCIEYSSQVPTGDAKKSCESNGSTWQVGPCSLDSAVGQCVDVAGSSVIYYQAFLTALGSTEESLEMSCTDADGTYSSLGSGA